MKEISFMGIDSIYSFIICSVVTKKLIIKITLIALILFIQNSIAYSQSDSIKCYTIDHFVKGTMEAINNKDAEYYVLLADYGGILKTLKDSTNEGELQKLNYETMLNHPETFDWIYRSSLSDLIKEIRKKLKTNDWNFKFDNYETIQRDTMEYGANYLVILNTLINKKKFHFKIYATCYKGCYYILKPIESELYKGWK